MSDDQRIRTTPRACDIAGMDTDELRRTFLIENVIRTDRIRMLFTDLDRMAVGGIAPGHAAVSLEPDRETGTEYFLQRRELGVINVGAAGTVTAEGARYELANLDCLYIGMGCRSVSFESADPATPARFFLLSTPAHQTYPTVHVARSQANPLVLGSQATANQRTIYQYIHAGGIKSCQLVMGFTELAVGSVWNTFPPHTHSRRTEIYFYFDLGQNVVMHLMGDPQHTRHLVVQDGQATLSPAWSIHCGCGTGNYRFIWAMGGENQTFDDMDKVAALELR